jgi:hypothetical protein
MSSRGTLLMEGVTSPAKNVFEGSSSFEMKRQWQEL